MYSRSIASTRCCAGSIPGMSESVDSGRPSGQPGAGVPIPASDRLERTALLALGTKLTSDAANLGLSALKRVDTGVHGVVAEHEFVGMLSGGTQHEARVALGDQFDRRLGALEDRDLSTRDAG